MRKRISSEMPAKGLVIGQNCCSGAPALAVSARNASAKPIAVFTTEGCIESRRKPISVWEHVAQ